MIWLLLTMGEGYIRIKIKKKKNQDEVLIMRSIHVGNGVAKQELGAT